MAEAGLNEPLRARLISGELLSNSEVTPTMLVSDVKLALQASSQTPVEYQRLLVDALEVSNSQTVLDAGLLEPDRVVTLVRATPASLSLLEFSADKPLLARYLLQCRADPDERDARGRTALQWAVKRGHAGVSLAILEAAGGATLNQRDSADGGTVLHWAARLGLADVCLGILRHRDFRETSARDSFGFTAYAWAEQEGFKDLCKLLPTNGASGPQIGNSV